MVRIKIKDLPKDKKISPDELRQVRGGIGMSFDPTMFTQATQAPYNRGYPQPYPFGHPAYFDITR